MKKGRDGYQIDPKRELRMDLILHKYQYYSKTSEVEEELKTSDFQQEKLVQCVIKLAVYSIFSWQTRLLIKIQYKSNKL